MTAPNVDGLLQDAATWRLVSALLERPRSAWRADVHALGREARDPRLRAAATDAAGADEGPWMDLLGTGGALGGREVAHDRATDPGRLMAEVQAHYDAFGFRPRNDEPPDHVSVEAGFVAFLRLKQAYAVARGQADEAEVTAVAATRFVEEHVASWALPLATGLEACGIAYLHAAADTAARLAGPPRYVSSRVPPSPDGEMTCGPGVE